MSYFNADQEAHMRSLASIPPEQRCWCGWSLMGQCWKCKTDRTCADKIAEWCPKCHNDGGPERGPIIHRIGCSRKATECTDSKK